MDDEGKCPVVHAASNGHLDIVMHLIQCPWPPEQENGPSLSRAAQCSLTAAAFKGHSNVSLINVSFYSKI